MSQLAPTMMINGNDDVDHNYDTRSRLAKRRSSGKIWDDRDNDAEITQKL